MFVKREQSVSFESLKKPCNGHSIVLQVNFSENATILAQKEVQAAHWHHAQATVFTAHAWIDSTTNFSMVVTSDDLNHTKQHFRLRAMHLVITQRKIPTH